MISADEWGRRRALGGFTQPQSCYTVGLSDLVHKRLFTRFLDSPEYARIRAALADGPVADTAEPVTPQAGIVGSEPDRDDGHTMGHEA